MTDPDPLAVAAMVSICGWDPTVQQTSTELLDGNGTPLLTVPSLHVTAVTSVRILHGGDADPTDLTVGVGEDVGWSENGCFLRNHGCYWPEGQRNVEIVYTGGYSPVPADLAAALASLGKRTGGPLLGITSRRMGTAAISHGAVIAEGDLLTVERMVFDRYRIPRAA